MQNEKKKGISRRDVLRYGAATGTVLAAMGPLGKHLLPSASGAIATQKHLTILNLFGGHDGLNMVIPAQGNALSTYMSRRLASSNSPRAAFSNWLIFSF